MGLAALSRGNVPEAIYTGGVGLAASIGGVLWTLRKIGEGKTRDSSGHDVPGASPAVRRARLAVCVLAAAGLLAAMRFRTPSRPANDGIIHDSTADVGFYRNSDFGFRLPYDPEWKDTTSESRREAANRRDGGVGFKSIRLSLRRDADKPEDVANIMLISSTGDDLGPIASGSDFLSRMVAQAQRGAAPPSEVKDEPSATIAGLKYDRLSLRKPLEGGHVRVMYWAAVKDGRLLSIQGYYYTPDGRQAIEALIERASAVSGE